MSQTRGNSIGNVECLFLRALGLVYFWAFASLGLQITGLVGARGVMPVARLLISIKAQLGTQAYWEVPSLFWVNSSDSALVLASALGTAAALLLMLQVVPRLATAVCFVLYLSLVSIGQPFTSFQWDALLLETGFLALFAGAPHLGWAYRLLLFRLMFESGWVKLASHDVNWRNLHALRFHFFTQPLPNPVAYYAHRLPDSVLDGFTAITLAIELAVPFLLFCPSRARRIGAIILATLQFAILLTGNFAFFNLLTLALCLWGFEDADFDLLAPWLRQRYRLWSFDAAGPAARAAGGAVVSMLIGLGALQLVNALLPRTQRVLPTVLAAVQPFEIVNGYGLFAVMTTTRGEIVLEGSNDQVNWRAYEFPYKPGRLSRELPWVAPLQPRLDWQMWFAALGDAQGNSWVGGLMYRLLTGEPSVCRLLEKLPFERPPHYLRAQMYDYTFTTPAERWRTGAVWKRELRGTWFGPVSLTGQ